MDEQQRMLLDEIGGEPLEGSGFKDETPAFDDEFELETEPEEHEQ